MLPISGTRCRTQRRRHADWGAGEGDRLRFGREKEPRRTFLHPRQGAATSGAGSVW